MNSEELLKTYVAAYKKAGDPFPFSKVEGPLFNNVGWNYWGKGKSNPVFYPVTQEEFRNPKLMEQRTYVQDKTLQMMNDALSQRVSPRVQSGYDGKTYNMSREAMLRRVNAIRRQKRADMSTWARFRKPDKGGMVAGK